MIAVRWTTLVVLVTIMVPLVSLAADTFSPGESVEVREGDEWSTARMVSKEGRKYKIRYADETEEWVAADRLRKPGSEGKSSPSVPASSGRPASSGALGPGSAVEIAFGKKWLPGKIVKASSGGWDVTYDGMESKGTKTVAAASVRARVGGAGDDAEKGITPIEAGSDLAANNKSAPQDGTRPLTDPDRDDMEMVDSSAEPAGPFQPDPLPAKLKPRSIGLKGPQIIANARVEKLHVSGSMALVNYPEHFERKTGALEVLDLASGKSKRAGAVMPEMKAAAVDRTGQRVALVGDPWKPQKGRIDIYSLPEVAKEPPKYECGFVPYGSFGDFDKDVPFVEFALEDRLITCNSGGTATLICWKLPECKALWSLPLGQFGFSANGVLVSSGGKQALMASTQSLVVVDIATGKLLASVPHGFANVYRVALNDGGDRVALCSADGLLGIFDLKTSQNVASMAVLPHGNLAFLDDDHVLSGHLVYSISKQVPVWRVFGGSDVTQSGGVLWYHDNNAVAGAKLGGQDLTSAEKSLTPDKLLLMPGGAVALEVNVSEGQQQVTDDLTKRIEQASLRLDPTAPVKLRATSSTGKPEEMVYADRFRGFGFHRFGFQVKRTVTPVVMRLEIAGPDGKAAWSREQTTGAPHMLQVEDAPSFEAAIDNALAKAVKIQPMWYGTLRIPTNVLKPQFAEGFGGSRLTGQGPVPMR